MCTYMTYGLRVRQILDLCGLLELLQSDVRYGKKTLAESLEGLEKEAKDPYRQLLFDLRRDYKAEYGEHYGSYIKNKFREYFRETALKEEEQTIFLSFLPVEGFYENELQLEVIQNTKKQLQQKANALQEKGKEYGKLALTFGVGTGAFLVLIFL